MSLTLPDSPFSLFFLLAVEHHQGVEIQCDKLPSHPKNSWRTHSHVLKLTLDHEKTNIRMYSCKNTCMWVIAPRF